MQTARMLLLLLATIAAAALAPCPAAAQLIDPEKGTLDGSPLDDLPPHIRLVADFGMRPDFSPDGRALLFLDRAPLGDVWRIDLASGAVRPLTTHFTHRGFARAQYLANGDVLLCGPTSGPLPSEQRPEAGRFTGVLSVLRSAYPNRAPQSLGLPCWEGVVASRSDLRIAWNRSDIDYTSPNLVDRVVFGISEIWTAELRFLRGQAIATGITRAVDRTAVSPVAVLEAQGFRPRAEREVIFTAYAHQGGEVMGIDLTTGAVRNYSNSPLYEEAECVSPDGRTVLVERDLESTAIPGPLDIWELPLDGSGAFRRLTYFNRHRGGWYASNPTWSRDGRSFAFQLSIDGDTEGEGAGLLLFDLDRFDAATAAR